MTFLAASLAFSCDLGSLLAFALAFRSRFCCALDQWGLTYRAPLPILTTLEQSEPELGRGMRGSPCGSALHGPICAQDVVVGTA